MADNAARAHQIADAFLRGFFETLDNLLASGIKANTDSVESFQEAGAQELLERFPAAITAEITGQGAIAVMLTREEACRVAGQVLGEHLDPEGPHGLPDAALQSMKEVFDPCIGAGIGYLSELLGNELRISEFHVRDAVQEDAASIAAAFGDGAYACTFRYPVAGDTEAEGIFVAAAGLMGIGNEARAPKPEISADEMQDILSGFDKAGKSVEEDASSKAASQRKRGAAPPNLEMVLDIGLNCTARLGRVEMPIRDILELGPGSIIEVGHLVDEPVELLVNGKLIARGDVVVIDEKFGLRITEIVSKEDRIKSLS